MSSAILEYDGTDAGRRLVESAYAAGVRAGRDSVHLRQSLLEVPEPVLRRPKAAGGPGAIYNDSLFWSKAQNDILASRLKAEVECIPGGPVQAPADARIERLELRMTNLESQVAELSLPRGEEPIDWLGLGRKDHFVTEEGLSLTHPEAHPFFKPGKATWSREIPTEPGWYWYELAGQGATRIVFRVDASTRAILSAISGLWGPRIEEPPPRENGAMLKGKPRPVAPAPRDVGPRCPKHGTDTEALCKRGHWWPSFCPACLAEMNVAYLQGLGYKIPPEGGEVEKV